MAPMTTLLRAAAGTAPAFLLAAAVLALAACAPAAPTPYNQQELVYGTVVNLTLYGDKAAAAGAAIAAELRDIDNRMSTQKPGSELNAVNAKAGREAVAVSGPTIEVLERGLAIARASDGLFDPSIGPLVELWNVVGENPTVPDQAAVDKARSLVDWRRIAVDEAKKTIFLGRPGMRLDFGGLAKGYAADRAAAIARGYGVESGLLSMGESSLYMIGGKPDGNDWRVGIQNPLPGKDFEVEHGSLLGVLSCRDTVVDTSGPYQRFFVRDGKRYHHIMDPRTGRPAENKLEQVTIVTPAAEDIPDGVSTVCYVLGLEQGLAFAKRYPQADAIFVTADKQVYLTPGLRSRFQLLDKTFTVHQAER